MVMLGCVQIPYIKSHVVQYIITRLIKPHGMSVKIDGVSGVLPFHLAINTLNISDGSGDLAQMHDLRIDLAASMLLRGKVHIEQIALSRFEWLRSVNAHPAPKIDGQLSAIITTMAPIILDQTMLKRAHIDVLKTPTANLSFHFQKDGVESLVELKSIVDSTRKNEAPVEGTFRLSPKGKGAVVTLRLNDLDGVMGGFPLTVEGDVQIADLDALLPSGSFSIVADQQKTMVQLATIDGDTRVQLITGKNTVTFDLKLKQMLEQHTTPIQNVVVQNGGLVKGSGNLAFDVERITFDYEGSSDADVSIKGAVTMLLPIRTLHINGAGSFQEMPFKFDGAINDVGINSALGHAMITIDGHVIDIASEKGILFDASGGAFVLMVNDHRFTGTALFDKTGCKIDLKPAWEWVKDSALKIHVHGDGAHIDGSLAIDYAKLTNGVLHGNGRAAIQLNHALNGSFSCTLSDGVAGGASLGHTTAHVEFNQGNGSLVVTTGKESILHLPYGIGKGQVSLHKQTLQLEAFKVTHHQQNIALKSPVSIDFKTHKIPSFLIGVGEKGVIQGFDKTQKIAFENVPLVAARILDSSWDMGGLLNGSVELTSHFDQWKGHIILTQLVPYLSRPLSNTALFKDFSWTVLFERQEKKVLIDTYMQRHNVHIFKAKGFVSTDADALLKNAIDFKITGELDVSLVSSLFNTPDRLGGILNINLVVGGELSNANVSGHVQVRDGLYDSADNGTYIANIAGTLKAVGKRLVIETLTGSDVRNLESTRKDAHVGELDITGHFEFAGLALPIFALDLKLNDLIVVHRDDMTMRATGDIKIHGPGLQSKITGAVALTPSLVMLEEFTDDDLTHIEIESLETHKKKKKDSGQPVFPIELTLNIDKNFYIRNLNLGLMSQWIGSMTVKGDLSAPYLEGTLTATKGKLSFFGKPLKIKEAKITYDSDHRNIPNVWFVGTREVEDVTVQLQFSGYATSTKLLFTSDPALPEDEVLSRLLFGKELSKISAGQSVQLASVGASLNNKQGLNFLESLRNSFGFDTFELKENDMKASTSESGQTASQALRVGKEFENMRISIDQSVGSTGSKATVSTALVKNVYLDLEVGEKNAGSGAGVSWVYRY